MTWNEEKAVATWGSRLRISWVIPTRIVPPRCGAGACACPAAPTTSTSISTAKVSATLRFTYAPPEELPDSYSLRRALPPLAVARTGGPGATIFAFDDPGATADECHMRRQLTPVHDRAVDQHRSNSQGPVEQDEIRSGARGNPSEIPAAEHPGGDGGRHADRIAHSDTEAYHVPHRLVQPQDAAGERPIGEARRVRDTQRLAGQLRSLAGASRRGDGVGDKGDAVVRLHGHDQPQHGGIDVDAVGDEAHRHPWIIQRRPDDARVAVAERAHGVEEMRHVPDPAGEGRPPLVVGGGGVPGGDDDPAPPRLSDQRARSPQLRSEGENLHQARMAAKQPPELCHTWTAQVPDLMCAVIRGTEERPFDVDPQHAGDAVPVRMPAVER